MLGLNLQGSNADYLRYRWFFTSKGNLVIGGKNDEQNEGVVRNFLKPDFTVMHTSSPGSPFIIIQNENPSKEEINEAAVFCACFSKDWKNGKKIIAVDIFKGKQIYKSKEMKTGTFGIKSDKKTLRVKPELVLIFQKGRLRAVPKMKKIREILVEISPGKLSKEEAVKKIYDIIKEKYHYPVSKDEIGSAIPSDKLFVK